MRVYTDKIAESSTWQAAVSKWENKLVAGILIAYSILQLNGIVFHGAWGQDFHTHVKYIRDASAHPWHFLTTYEEGRTNPPLFHFLGGQINTLTHGYYFVEVIALFCVAANVAGLYALFVLIRRFIRTPLLRLSVFLFLVFLPFAVIHAEVLATDAIGTPIFIFYLYLLLRFNDRLNSRQFRRTLFLAMAVLLTGILTKFTFEALIVGTAFILLGQWWVAAIDNRRLVEAAIFLCVIPACVSAVLVYQFKSQQRGTIGFTKSYNGWGAMSYRSAFFFRAADPYLLDAPPYNEEIAAAPGLDGAPSYGTPGTLYHLTIREKFSYPALLQLAMFTDYMNFRQFDPLRTARPYGGRRSRSNQNKMSVAVKTGLLFTIMALMGVVVMGYRAAWKTFVRRSAQNLDIVCILVLALSLYVPALLILPFAPTYFFGYYLPRLVMPSLLCFFLLGFVLVETTILSRWPRAIWVVVALVVLQSTLHASFLWTWPTLEDLQLAPSAPPMTSTSSGTSSKSRSGAAVPTPGTCKPALDALQRPGGSITIAVGCLPRLVGAEEGPMRWAAEGITAPGYLVYGPSILLPAGSYDVSMDITSAALPGEQVGNWDAGFFEVPSAEVRLGQGPIFGRVKEIRARINIDAAGAKMPFQFRVVYNGKGDLRVRSLTITRRS